MLTSLVERVEWEADLAHLRHYLTGWFSYTFESHRRALWRRRLKQLLDAGDADAQASPSLRVTCSWPGSL